MLGTDDKLWVASGEGSGHVTRNVRLALAVVDLVEVGREVGRKGGQDDRGEIHQKEGGGGRDGGMEGEREGRRAAQKETLIHCS